MDGKDSTITGWSLLRGPQSTVEMVVMIDDGARQSLGSQLPDIAKFIQALPPNAKVAVAYMQNGRAVFGGPLGAHLTADRAAAIRESCTCLAAEELARAPARIFASPTWPSIGHRRMPMLAARLSRD